ncbi:MAG: hypothetical protein NT106_00180 [Candidatus Sumerlaeota bacterium]|nr:hypothetical protein [Candidatus Sumerlaeota bacterium]
MNTKGFLRTGHLILAVLLILSCNLCFSQSFSVYNGHMDSLAGWDGITVDGRDNGPYQGTATFQAINSSSDTSPTPGSIVFTLSGTFLMGSLTQDLKITASGQKVSISADVARDGNWTSGLIFGFYDITTTYDVYPGCSVDVTTLGSADTDGTLNSFYTVAVNNVTLPNDGTNVRVFLGNTATPWTATTIGAKFAIDNVKALVSSGEPEWNLYN